MARNDWILDVLADLKTFASANGLETLAEQLGDTRLIAAVEIAKLEDEPKTRVDVQESRFEPHIGGVGRH
ncbi:hypothetical protein [Ruegeria hyattellae]|uniref:hypothetical protein n=1 Tax=Ruegeria hyattellae TaxID=3233337 RepID=UPI00355B2F72